MKTNSLFIVLEGVDGSGKTTQINMLKEIYPDAVFIHEPGGTDLGNKIRALLFDHKNNISNMSELFLFMAARAQVVDEVILPALSMGKLVIADRFILSSEIYQGISKGFIQEVRLLNDMVAHQVIPDHTFILGLSYEDYKKRIEGRARDLDRIEKTYSAYTEVICKTYMDFVNADSSMFTIIDSTDLPVNICKQISAFIAKNLFEK